MTEAKRKRRRHRRLNGTTSRPQGAARESTHDQTQARFSRLEQRESEPHESHARHLNHHQPSVRVRASFSRTSEPLELDLFSDSLADVSAARPGHDLVTMAEPSISREQIPPQRNLERLCATLPDKNAKSLIEAHGLLPEPAPLTVRTDRPAPEGTAPDCTSETWDEDFVFPQDDSRHLDAERSESYPMNASGTNVKKSSSDNSCANDTYESKMAIPRAASSRTIKPSKSHEASAPLSTRVSKQKVNTNTRRVDVGNDLYDDVVIEATGIPGLTSEESLRSSLSWEREDKNKSGPKQIYADQSPPQNAIETAERATCIDEAPLHKRKKTLSSSFLSRLLWRRQSRSQMKVQAAHTSAEQEAIMMSSTPEIPIRKEQHSMRSRNLASARQNHVTSSSRTRQSENASIVSTKPNQHSKTFSAHESESTAGSTMSKWRGRSGHSTSTSNLTSDETADTTLESSSLSRCVSAKTMVRHSCSTSILPSSDRPHAEDGEEGNWYIRKSAEYPSSLALVSVSNAISESSILQAPGPDPQRSDWPRCPQLQPNVLNPSLSREFDNGYSTALSHCSKYPSDRRSSLGDFKVPARISNSQSAVRGEMSRVRIFADGIKDLKKLQSEKKQLLNKIDAEILSKQERGRVIGVEQTYSGWWECAEVLVNLGDGTSSTHSDADHGTTAVAQFENKTCPSPTQLALSEKISQKTFKGTDVERSFEASAVATPPAQITHTTSAHSSRVAPEREVDILSSMLAGRPIGQAGWLTMPDDFHRRLPETCFRINSLPSSDMRNSFGIMELGRNDPCSSFSVESVDCTARADFTKEQPLGGASLTFDGARVQEPRWLHTSRHKGTGALEGLKIAIEAAPSTHNKTRNGFPPKLSHLSSLLSQGAKRPRPPSTTSGRSSRLSTSTILFPSTPDDPAMGEQVSYAHLSSTPTQKQRADIADSRTSLERMSPKSRHQPTESTPPRARRSPRHFSFWRRLSMRSPKTQGGSEPDSALPESSSESDWLEYGGTSPRQNSSPGATPLPTQVPSTASRQGRCSASRAGSIRMRNKDLMLWGFEHESALPRTPKTESCSSDASTSGSASIDGMWQRISERTKETMPSFLDRSLLGQSVDTTLSNAQERGNKELRSWSRTRKPLQKGRICQQPGSGNEGICAYSPRSPTSLSHSDLTPASTHTVSTTLDSPLALQRKMTMRPEAMPSLNGYLEITLTHCRESVSQLHRLQQELLTAKA